MFPLLHTDYQGLLQRTGAHVFATSSSAGRSQREQGFWSSKKVCDTGEPESTKCCHFLPYASVDPTIPLKAVLTIARALEKVKPVNLVFAARVGIGLGIRLVILLYPFFRCCPFHTNTLWQTRCTAEP